MTLFPNIVNSCDPEKAKDKPDLLSVLITWRLENELIGFTKTRKWSLKFEGKPCTFSLSFLNYFLIKNHSMQGWRAITRHGVTRKRKEITRKKKIKNKQESGLGRVYREKVSINTRLKAI